MTDTAERPERPEEEPTRGFGRIWWAVVGVLALALLISGVGLISSLAAQRSAADDRAEASEAATDMARALATTEASTADELAAVQAIDQLATPLGAAAVAATNHRALERACEDVAAGAEVDAQALSLEVASELAGSLDGVEAEHLLAVIDTDSFEDDASCEELG